MSLVLIGLCRKAQSRQAPKLQLEMKTEPASWKHSRDGPAHELLSQAHLHLPHVCSQLSATAQAVFSDVSVASSSVCEH